MVLLIVDKTSYTDYCVISQHEKLDVRTPSVSGHLVFIGMDFFLLAEDDIRGSP